MAYATATVLAYAALASAVVGTGVSIYGQQQAAKAQEDAAAYNAKIAEAEARNREQEGAEQIRRARIQKRQQMAALRARLAAGGALTTTGTPLAILGESSARLELGLQDAARATNMEAASMRAQGRMGLWEASQAKTAANLSSIGTGLQGVSSAAGGGYDFYKSGSFTRTKRTA